MDAHTFDRLTVALADRSNRRGALRLLAGGVLGGLLAQRAVIRTLAAQPAGSDRDGDGLFDVDEVDVYGTNPDAFDTDGDLIGDGEEVYFGTDPLTSNEPPQRVDTDGDGLYDDDEREVYGTDPNVFDTDGDGIGDGDELLNGTDPLVLNVGPAPVSTCRVTGARCDVDAECCPGALCCFNGGSLANHCTDVATTGGVCPGDTPPDFCSISRTECGGDCADTLSDPNHCGACFNMCALGHICDFGICCAEGLVNCGDHCTDLRSDMYNCGRCRNICDSAICNGGRCAPI